MTREVEHLAKRRARAAVVCVVDIGIGEKHREPDAVEIVAACPRFFQEALEEGESGFVLTLCRVTATESVGGGGRISRAELARVEGPFKKIDRVGNLAAAASQPPETELRARQSPDESALLRAVS